MNGETTSDSTIASEPAVGSIDTPVGRLDVVAVGAAIVEIRFGALAPTRPAAGSAVLDRALAQLEDYFAGTRTDFDLPLDPVGTVFQHQAWAVLRTIPYGVTISYGQQARLLGDPKKSRAVGAANGRNPIPIVVPCHRVVGSDGRLTGFAGGLEAKAWLLEHERRTLASGR